MLFMVLVRHSILPYIMKLVGPLVRNFLQQKPTSKSMCGLLGVVGVVDGTFIFISKPMNNPEDYSIQNPKLLLKLSSCDL